MYYSCSVHSSNTTLLECIGYNCKFLFIDGSGERGEKDASKITTYPPGAVRFDCELRAVQVSCGFHHSGKNKSMLIMAEVFF